MELFSGLTVFALPWFTAPSQVFLEKRNKRMPLHLLEAGYIRGIFTVPLNLADLAHGAITL